MVGEKNPRLCTVGGQSGGTFIVGGNNTGTYRVGAVGGKNGGTHVYGWWTEWWNLYGLWT
jgi:hypothetical protein